MCGRFACNLEPGILQCACTYYDAKTSRYKKPEWRQHPMSKGGYESSEDTSAAYSSAESSAESAALSAAENPPTGKYYPTVNIAPSKFTPVLIHDPETGERILQPMKWGLIPVWHKGSAKALRLSTINCRVEGMTRSRLWRHPLSNRRLCIIIAQGFYEWKAPKNKMPKQPYFVFMSQDSSKFGPSDVVNEEVWKQSTWSETQGWSGPRLVMMAGVYDIWYDVDTNPVYSYSIITTPADRNMTWLHSRMPAILETPEDIAEWLNPREDATLDDMVKILKPIPITGLDWYLVSNKVNNSRCQDLDCAQPKRLEGIMEAKTEEKENKEEVELGVGMRAKDIEGEKPLGMKMEDEISGADFKKNEKEMEEGAIKKSKIATP